jgi:hypothetical protein
MKKWTEKRRIKGEREEKDLRSDKETERASTRVSDVVINHPTQ